MKNKIAVLASTATMMGLVGLVLAAAPAGSLESGLSPIGVWATAGAKSHVQIKTCEGQLCGTIVWLQNPLDKDGKDSLDSKNPDPGLQTRKILGLALLTGFVQDRNDPSVWTSGQIYDPGNGKLYSCNLTLENNTTLRVRGYVGLSIFGQTQIWTRVQ